MTNEISVLIQANELGDGYRTQEERAAFVAMELEQLALKYNPRTLQRGLLVAAAAEFRGREFAARDAAALMKDAAARFGAGKTLRSLSAADIEEAAQQE